VQEVVCAPGSHTARVLHVELAGALVTEAPAGSVVAFSVAQSSLQARRCKVVQLMHCVLCLLIRSGMQVPETCLARADSAPEVRVRRAWARLCHLQKPRRALQRRSLLTCSSWTAPTRLGQAASCAATLALPQHRAASQRCCLRLTGAHAAYWTARQQL
jgi:hypothetical protein